MLQLAGYQNSEAVAIIKKLGVSSVGTAVTGALATSVVAAVVAKEKLDPVLDFDVTDLSDTKMYAALGVSYALHYGSIYLASRSNRALLQNDYACPNLWATSLYFLLRKIDPDKQWLQRSGVHAGTFAPAVIQEPTVMLPSFTTDILGPQVVFARNIAGTGINLAEAAINLGYLGYRKAQERRNSR